MRIAEKKKHIYSTDIYDNKRDPISKLRPVDLKEMYIPGRPSSAVSKKASVMPYRSGVYVLDPSVLGENNYSEDTSPTMMFLSQDRSL